MVLSLLPVSWSLIQDVGFDILASFFLLPVDLFGVFAVRRRPSHPREPTSTSNARVQPPPSVATITIRIKKKTAFIAFAFANKECAFVQLVANVER